MKEENQRNNDVARPSNLSVQERIIINNGKPIYAIKLNDEKSNRNHIYIHHGEVYFSDSIYGGAAEFNFDEESHRFAKEIFLSQLQTDIKRRIYELKQMESIFDMLGIKHFITEPMQEIKMLNDGSSIAKKIQSKFKKQCTREEIEDI